MRVVGIDYSSHAVDIVTLPYEIEHGEGDHVWRRFSFDTPDKTDQGCFNAVRRVRERLAEPGLSAIFEEAILVYIEEPFGHSRATHGCLCRVQGAIIASLPADIRKYAKVNEIPAQAWREILTGRPRMGKSDEEKARVIAAVKSLGYDLGLAADHNAYEALGIAWAAREENRRAVRLAEAQSA
jgi:hypothetical protein